MNKELIQLIDISKSFDGQMVLDELNLNIHENEFVTLLGPSGCGKTTTLRILGGFTGPDKGRVVFDGQDITKIPPNKRPLNTVFQKYALFPHMNVYNNIAFGLKIKKEPKDIIEQKGGKVTGSVTGKTTCLVNNDIASASSKNKKARDLGIPVLSEEDFLERYEIAGEKG